jgi:hypothetical protein
MKVFMMKKVLSIFSLFYLLFLQFEAKASTAKCDRERSTCEKIPEDITTPPGAENLINPFGCFAGRDCPGTVGSMNWMDADLLNLKSNANTRTTSTNTAIQITQADFESIVQVGKSILFSEGRYDGFTMNIGIADASNAQTWTLPSNLAQYIDASTSRLDILSPSSIPAAMQVVGATHVLKEILVEPNGDEANTYMHLQIDGTEITNLGTSYDYEEGSDDNFDEEPDVELYDVPLDLGDNQTTDEFPMDETRNENFLKVNTVTSVDAFGTINTPYGSFPCLRQTELIKYYKRSNITQAYRTDPNYVFRRIKWITKAGYVFSAAVQSEDGSHNAFMVFPEQTRFVPTNTLTSLAAIKINNDSKSVSINNTDFVADESAILDINSDSLGILIPRISMANRPSSPAEGLLVYQVDNTAGFYYFDGTAWQRLSANLPVSMSANARISNSEILGNSSIRGKNQLNKGSVFVKFDQPQDNFENSLINIQLEGDCNGVYISKKTREGFEVKELHKGKSNVKFSWEIR